MSRSLVFFLLAVSSCAVKEKQAVQETDSLSTASRVVPVDSLASKVATTQPVFDSAGLWGRSTLEVAERWKRIKSDSVQNLVDVDVLYNQYRLENQIGIMTTIVNEDTVVQYFILQFTYTSNDEGKYITGEEQLLGTVPDAIADIQTPGDGMLYLLMNEKDTIELKKIFAPGVTISNLGLIDFTETFCYIGLTRNHFNELGDGDISFSGGGWGDLYGWKKDKSGVRLVGVNRYSH
jgi:hypothetical protein